MELFIILVIAATSYQGGKAAQKVETYESKQLCFDHQYETREKGCYKLESQPVKETAKK